MMLSTFKHVWTDGGDPILSPFFFLFFYKNKSARRMSTSFLICF